MKKTVKKRYIVDEKGKKTAVIIPIKEYQKVVKDLEELEDIRLIEEAKKEPSRPFSEFDKELKEKGLV